MHAQKMDLMYVWCAVEAYR